MVGCVQALGVRCGAVRVWRAMAWPIGRLWRVCMVGIGVCRRWRTVCMALAYGVQACVGTVYGAMALGVRMVSVGYTLGVRVYGVCVWCTCVCRYIDVVSV